MPSVLLALLLPFGVTDARAASDKDAPEAPPSVVEALGDAALGQLEASYASTLVWEHRATFRQRGAVTGLAVASARDGEVPAWLAIDAAGWAWRSEDRGSSWVLVMRGAAAPEARGKEEVLLEAESLRDELLEGAEPDVVGTEVDTTAVREALQTANEEASAATPSGNGGQEIEPRVWFHPDEPRVAFLSRADGTWRSDDGGRNWEFVDSMLATTFFAVDGTLLAGTSDGVRWSTDGGRGWIDVEDATDGVFIHGLARAGSYVYASGDRGLFRSADGLRWVTARSVEGTPVLAVVPDASWPGGAWVATPGGVLRTDDDGATFYATERAVLRGLRQIVPLPGAGHLLALTADGPWETMDGGLRWLPLARLLTEPDVRDVAFDEGLPVIATRSGVFRLTKPMELAERPRAVPLPPLYDMIARAQQRRGLDTDMLSLARRRVAAALAPRFEVVYDWGKGAGRTADFIDAANTEANDGDWSLTARACWGACASSASSIVYDPSEAAYLADDTLFVVGDQVFDEGDAVAAAANVAQSIRSYERYTAGVVTEAWMARQRLNQEQAVVDLLPLKDQVVHALAIAEADARLDLYTDGAFSRQLAILQAQPQEPR